MSLGEISIIIAQFIVERLHRHTAANIPAVLVARREEGCKSLIPIYYKIFACIRFHHIYLPSILEHWNC